MRQTADPINHVQAAENYLRRADEIANRDGHLEFRDQLVERFLTFAQVHATLAVAQQVSLYPDPTL